MTHKKTLTGILFTLCIIVWGTIAWKVYSSLYEEKVSEPRFLTKKKPKIDKTIALLLDYRDPFFR